MLYTVATYLHLFYIATVSPWTSIGCLVNHYSPSNTIQWTQQKRNDVVILCSRLWQSSEHPVHLLLNTKFEKRVEVVWTACCHSQELCALCDMTGWLRRAQSREQSCGFFLVFWKCWAPWILSLWNVKKIIFEMLKNNIAASQYKSHLKLTHTVRAQSKINCYSPVASHHLSIFPCFQRFYANANPFLVNC